MTLLTPLQAHDTVHIIAPAGTLPNAEEALEACRTFLESWGLEASWSEEIFGGESDFLGLANSDEKRFADLKHTLLDPQVKIIWCFRGGYGCMRLLPYLQEICEVSTPKIFIGFSDITLLHTAFQKKWDWSTLHASHIAAMALGKTMPEENEVLRQLLFAERSSIELPLAPLNAIAHKTATLTSSMTGGNLTLIMRTLGTDFEIDFQDKILLLEEVGEPARKIDGMLRQLLLMAQKPGAIVLGDMTTENEKQREITAHCLQDFALLAERLGIPVLKTEAIGHGLQNYPVPLGTRTTLTLGEKPLLQIANLIER